MERNLAARCTPANIVIWSEEYIRDSKGDENAVEKAYSKWFEMSSGGLADGTLRAGYCLGYNVILYALRKYSMGELLKLNRKSSYLIAQEALNDWVNDAK